MARPKKITALFANVRQRDKSLSGWMRTHHDELLEELGPGRIVWASAMQVIAGLGLVDAHGNAPNRDTAFRTWRRVRAEVAKSRALRQSRLAATLAPGEFAPGVRSLFSDAAGAPAGNLLPATEKRMRLEIRPARPFADLPNSPIPTSNVSTVAPGPATGVGVGNAAEQIQRVFDIIGAARTPMPKKIP